MKPITFVMLFFVLHMVSPTLGEQVASNLADWAEGSSQHNDGANREHYNTAAILPWKHFLGDWRDANEAEQGDVAYAVTKVEDSDTHKPVRWNVTTLVKEWTDGRQPNQGMLLRSTNPQVNDQRVVNQWGPILFGSRESSDPTLRPKLELTGESGTVSLDAVADTYLTKSTFRSKGQADELRVSAAPDHLLIRFDLKQATKVGAISNATLILQTTKQYGSASIGVFRCCQGHGEPESLPVLGIAAKYQNDQGIADDPDVIFATSFERTNWQSEWTSAEPKDKIDTVNADTRFQKFLPSQGKALRSRIAKGSTTALNTLFKFDEQTGTEPEEIYFRYYLRLADDWNQTVQGGKLPGISGTYGRTGWGGRRSYGKQGWSARGLFKMTVPAGNPLAGRTPIGFYCYHADMKSSYGTNWVWSKGYRGYLATNQWYAIEQYCRLNTPGEKNGVLRGWIDGHLAFEKADIRFRLTDKLRIEQVWMNVYHGGTTPSPHNQHVFIDNVVIAKHYIGPMNSKP